MKNLPFFTFRFDVNPVEKKSSTLFSCNFQKSSSQGNSPVWFVFAGMGTQWQGMGRQMMEVDVFKKSILQSDKLLKPYDVNLYDLIMEGDAAAFENIVHSFVGIAAIQVRKSYNAKKFLKILTVLTNTSNTC